MMFPGLNRASKPASSGVAPLTQTPDDSRRYAASAASRTPPGQRLTSTQRFVVEPVWPNGGWMTRPVNDRNYDVQVMTGYPMSTVGAGQWQRGQLVRMDTPTLQPNSKGLFMYDPTDVSTWKYAS